MSKKEEAQKYFSMGYNCAQAVVLAFADEIGLDRSTLAKMSVGLGGGVGRMREVCGAVSGMAMAGGLLFGTDDPMSKNEIYPLVQELAGEFKKENGSVVCRELLAGVTVSDGARAEERTETYYKKRPCPELVGMAAEILEKRIDF